LLDLKRAISFVHFPPDNQKMEAARRRLKFDELLRLQIFAAKVKQELKKLPAPKAVFNEKATKQFVQGLPFELTEAQRKAAWEIVKDISRPRPMNRLLEGDVGSGKTVVVAIAALNAVGVCDHVTAASDLVTNKGQVAIMAPTEILARQHFKTFSKLLGPHGVQVELRTSSEKGKKGIIDSNVVVGTHALIQDSVKFKDLVLAVVDEQHRFGVRQRQALKDKREDGKMPHLLTLTATPIPRSLALVFYGDLDLSVLNEMPKGRQRIETVLVSNASQPPPHKPTHPPLKLRGGGEKGTASNFAKQNLEVVPFSREQAYQFIRTEVAAGHQVFWTCPIIDPSDTLGVRAATEVFEHLRTEIFSDLRIGLLHGRMKSKEREKVMEAFVGPSCHHERSEGSRDSSPAVQNDRGHTIDILVATPVIEVGIDVPNATVMVIEGAQRFGLAQLHQFRGRVGRGEAKSYCLLMVEEKGTASNFAAQNLEVVPFSARIKAFLECDNGFELAERDLTLRGPGDTYGIAQSGFPEFKIASFADVEIAKEAKEAAEGILTRDPELTNYSELKQAILDKEGRTHLE
ncbi:MAG: ATP-dependent DNA helicase RecG, partial [Parcubacteria group bacterium GW2011_GWC2_45_7]